MKNVTPKEIRERLGIPEPSRWQRTKQQLPQTGAEWSCLVIIILAVVTVLLSFVGFVALIWILVRFAFGF